jgi:hypothetical protein
MEMNKQYRIVSIRMFVLIACLTLIHRCAANEPRAISENSPREVPPDKNYEKQRIAMQRMFTAAPSSCRIV